jgi:hypothetical protein
MKSFARRLTFLTPGLFSFLKPGRPQQFDGLVSRESKTQNALLTSLKDEDTKRWKQDGDSKLLVNPDSATYGRHWETEAGVYVIPLDGDHSGMVKLGPRDTDGYPKIRRVMREFVQLAIPVVKVRLSDAPLIAPLTNWKPPDVSLAKRKAESSVDEEPEAKMIKVDRAPKPPNAEDQQGKLSHHGLCLFRFS